MNSVGNANDTTTTTTTTHHEVKGARTSNSSKTSSHCYCLRVCQCAIKKSPMKYLTRPSKRILSQCQIVMACLLMTNSGENISILTFFWDEKIKSKPTRAKESSNKG